MSRFRRMSLLVLVCCAAYVCLVLRVQNLLSANQSRGLKHVIALLEYDAGMMSSRQPAVDRDNVSPETSPDDVENRIASSDVDNRVASNYYILEQDTDTTAAQHEDVISNVMPFKQPPYNSVEKDISGEEKIQRNVVPFKLSPNNIEKKPFFVGDEKIPRAMRLRGVEKNSGEADSEERDVSLTDHPRQISGRAGIEERTIPFTDHPSDGEETPPLSDNHSNKAVVEEWSVPFTDQPRQNSGEAGDGEPISPFNDRTPSFNDLHSAEERTIIFTNHPNVEEEPLPITTDPPRQNHGEAGDGERIPPLNNQNPSSNNLHSAEEWTKSFTTNHPGLEKDPLPRTTEPPRQNYGEAGENDRTPSFNDLHSAEERTTPFTTSNHPSDEEDPPRQRNVSFTRVGDLYVYAAFLDLRVTVPGAGRSVRVLALTRRESGDSDSLVCHVQDDAERVLVLYAQQYRTAETHGKAYEGCIYSCVLPDTLHTLPQHVSVFPLSQRQNRSRVLVNLTLTTLPPDLHPTNQKIGVCVPPLFGTLSLSLVVNFIQMCKVLGADRIFMYLGGKVSWEIRTFLEFHAAQRDSGVSVVAWDLPSEVEGGTEDRIWYHGQVLAVQDCLYHNMASLRFLLFMDLDEMLVPQRNDTWPQMITQVFRTQDRRTAAALSFQSAFFDPTRVPEDTENILYFQHLHRTKGLSQVRRKLLVQPLKVFEVGVHHLSRAVSQEFTSVDISEDVALLHHYRACAKLYEPDMKCYPTKKDTRILKYKDRLTHLSHKLISVASKLFV